MAKGKADPRRGLAPRRGISALMSDLEAAPSGVSGAAGAGDGLVPVDLISPSPVQPRRAFAEAALAELAASIRERGVVQPLVLRPHPRAAGRYEIVAGERRWRAAQRARVHAVPAVVRDLGDAEALEVALVENVQRADLNAVEEAAGLRELTERFGHTQEALARALGKSRSHVANLLRLLSLPEAVQGLVRSGALSAGHARALAGAADPEALARRVAAEGLSVRQAEALARDARAPRKRRARAQKDADTRAAERDLAAALGMRVRVDPAPDGGGSVTVRYAGPGQFDEIRRRLAVTHGTG